MRRRVRKAAPGAREIEPISGRAAISIKKALRVMRPEVVQSTARSNIASIALSPGALRSHIVGASFRLASGPDMTRRSPLPAAASRLLDWRVLLSLFFVLTLALAPSLAEARGGGGKSSFGSRGSRTFENNSAAPITRSANPTPAGGEPGFRHGWGRRGKSWRQLLSASSVPDRADRRTARGGAVQPSRRHGPLSRRHPAIPDYRAADLFRDPTSFRLFRTPRPGRRG